MDKIMETLNSEYDRALNDYVLAADSIDDIDTRKKKLETLHEQRLDVIRLREEKRDHIIKNVLEIVGIALPITISSYWMAKGMRFEETGTFVSRTGQWVSQHLRLFRK